MKRRNFFKGLLGLAGVAVLPKSKEIPKEQTDDANDYMKRPKHWMEGELNNKYEWGEYSVPIKIVPHNKKDKKTVEVLNDILEYNKKEYLRLLSESMFKT